MADIKELEVFEVKLAKKAEYVILKSNHGGPFTEPPIPTKPMSYGKAKLWVDTQLSGYKGLDPYHIIPVSLYEKLKDPKNKLYPHLKKLVRKASSEVDRRNKMASIVELFGYERMLLADMAVHAPKRQQAKQILDVTRTKLRVVFTPIWKAYVTVQGGSHNKFHYFGVYEDKDGGFVAANTYGRIGYPNTYKPHEIGTFDAFDEAKAAAKAKLKSKTKPGRKGGEYIPTKMEL